VFCVVGFTVCCSCVTVCVAVVLQLCCSVFCDASLLAFRKGVVWYSVLQLCCCVLQCVLFGLSNGNPKGISVVRCVAVVLQCVLQLCCSVYCVASLLAI